MDAPAGGGRSACIRAATRPRWDLVVVVRLAECFDVMSETFTPRQPATVPDETGLATLFGGRMQPMAALLYEHCVRASLAWSLKDATTGRYVWVNAPMAALLGRPAAQIVGTTDAELMASAQAGLLRAADHAALAQVSATVSEHRLELASGRRELSAMRLALPGGEQPGSPRLLAALWTDLGAQRQRESQLGAALAQIEQQQRELAELRREIEDTAVRDATTGLHHSVYFDDMLRRELDLSAREHREFALVLVVLDTRGGDPAVGSVLHTRLLEALGNLLRRNTRSMDSSCQLGPDRFALVLSGVGLATAHARMESLRRQCAAHIVVLDGREHGLSVSMGVASYPHTADAQLALTQAASQALAEAIRRGGNHVALASIRFETG